MAEEKQNQIPPKLLSIGCLVLEAPGTAEAAGAVVVIEVATANTYHGDPVEQRALDRRWVRHDRKGRNDQGEKQWAKRHGDLPGSTVIPLLDGSHG